MKSFRNLASPTALVICSGHDITITAQDVVAGSVPVPKEVDIYFCDKKGNGIGVGVDERRNMASCSLTAAKGRTVGLAVGIGRNSDIGKSVEWKRIQEYPFDSSIKRMPFTSNPRVL
ncbi:hypothetical protein CF319_g9329 [Tilletia indica]|nr:hypothetical protein CF319_g9329 [Tilletia indica]